MCPHLLLVEKSRCMHADAFFNKCSYGFLALKAEPLLVGAC